MSALVITTPRPNRQLLSQVFGMNQTAIRFLESMAQDITINIPDAIASNATGPVILLAQMLADSRVAVPERANNGMIALMESAGQVAQPPGAYRVQSTNTFQKASTTGTALASGMTANVASLALAAGTWDVSGTVVFNAAAATVLEAITAGVASASATLGTPDTYQEQQLTFSSSGPINLLAPMTRIVLANAATVWIVAQATFTTSTLSADGYISARPV